MIQALGFSESLLGSFKSARKLLEGFDASDGQALPAFASPFWARPRPRAELAGVAEEPVDNQQALVRRESVVNLENFKKQYVRRRWKLSFSIVSLCNHLTRSLMKKVHLRPDENLRNCESDTEEDIAKRKALHPRRRSSTS
ncbi:Death-associated protein kinase 2 [Pteropus alecto]|uniref:Death-associated protein kinase 2 n=1 Tax=Pteropus alecto TaxID=9402 RepID=L5K4E2_PTEAL|nr:Death-associated protein kinase 2 [Pteropus alecto]